MPTRRPRIETAGKRRWRLLQPQARRMRSEPTEGEAVLWEALRGGKLGVRFRRQHAIGRFIVDFYCVAARLVVEVDGESHKGMERKDLEPDSELQAMGYCVLRVTNGEVIHSLANVMAKI